MKIINKIMDRNELNIQREILLKTLRKGKKGRPYCGIKHYSRQELNLLRDNKLKKIINQI